MKNVLFIIDSLFQGGAETLVKDYCIFLSPEKYNVSILCLRRLSTIYEHFLTNRGIKIYYLSDYGFYKSNTLIGKIITRLLIMMGLDVFIARKIIKNSKIDVIHAHLFTLDLLRRINPDNKLKILYTVHNEPQKYWHGKTRLSRREFKACQWLIEHKGMKLIALHSEMCKELNALFNVSNTVVVNNGIDFSKFETALPRRSIREKLGIPSNFFVIGHVGRFVEQKNHFFLLDVFFEFVKENPNSLLLLVGSGPLLETFIAKVTKLGLEKHVMLLGNRADVPDLMNAMDVFVFPSIFEGLGIVLIEAQKMGLPCVISDKIPQAATISNLTKTVSLSESAQHWAQIISQFKVSSIVYNNLKNWDMKEIVRKLEFLYA